MVELQDRIPTCPNRKKLTFEDDNSLRYATVEYADEPLVEGTVVNKKNVLDTVYPNSNNNSVGVIVTKSGEVNDERWLPCDGRFINKDDYPVLWEQLTGGVDKLLFDRILSDCQPEDGKTYNLFVKYKNYRLLGRYEDNTGISYASFDDGVTWQAANLSYSAIRYSSGYDHFVFDNGVVMLGCSYNDCFYVSTDGLTFTTLSSNNAAIECCNRRNGFNAYIDWNGSNYGIMYRVYTGSGTRIKIGSTAYSPIPNKEGALYKHPDGSYYYLDTGGTPVAVTCEYPLCNSSSVVDDDFNIYTFDNNILYVFNENYQLIGTKNMESYTDVSLRLVISTDLYFVSGGVLYRAENLINDLENSEIVALNSSMPSGRLKYDGVDTLYLVAAASPRGSYSTLGEVGLPSLSALDNPPTQSYIKAK